ncbi:hypothetical protein EYC84_005363 [Monilinia fructicola]|uniref:Uncharacterized protein n=1 Tax=Monilinia fructicola TaxID=38448 RepID=A0A5M9JYR9_MONFR|nr:hypothetical protein EYC84_005363 [Monilinia fructicola]
MDKASILEKAESTNKIYGYVFEMKLPKDFEAREKRIVDFEDAVLRRKIYQILANDTSKAFQIPTRKVTPEMIKARAFGFSVLDCVGNTSQLDTEQSG